MNLHRVHHQQLPASGDIVGTAGHELFGSVQDGAERIIIMTVFGKGKPFVIGFEQINAVCRPPVKGDFAGGI